MNAKIEVNFDPSSEDQVAALNLFLKTVAGGTLELDKVPMGKIQSLETEEDEEEEKPKKVKASKTKKSKAKAKHEPEKEEEDSPSATIEEIRKLVSSKAKDHREVIKEKLTELEADNVTSLSTDHYDSFYEFLKEL